MTDMTDHEAAKAYRAHLTAQAAFSAKNKDKVAESGAPQRNHVALAVLNVIFEGWCKRCPVSKEVLGDALDLLQEDGYDRDATWKRMKVMARQPRRKLKPPRKCAPKMDASADLGPEVR